MNLIECIKLAFGAIRANKMRSFLTMLGIIIGIASVIAVIAIGEGGNAMMHKEFETFGIGRAQVWHNWSKNPSGRDFMNHGDVAIIKRAFEDDILGISPNFSSSGEITINKQVKSAYINGVNEEYNKINVRNIIYGRYINESDLKSFRNVAVIDDETAIKNFGRKDVIGEKIKIRTRSRSLPLTIVGVYEIKKSFINQNFGRERPVELYMPLSSVEKMFGIGDTVYSIEINFKSSRDINTILEKIVLLLERRHRNEGKEIYRSYTAESEMQSVSKVTGVMTLVISAIAAISLLVGGIGIMNIMLVSVTERTREIGIRKAIGARHQDIMIQFLIEAVIISGMGGIIGTTIGITLSTIVTTYIQVDPAISLKTVLIACLFSAGVGIFFGIFPANKAAKLDPIEALRYE